MNGFRAFDREERAALPPRLLAAVIRSRVGFVPFLDLNSSVHVGYSMDASSKVVENDDKLAIA